MVKDLKDKIKISLIKKFLLLLALLLIILNLAPIAKDCVKDSEEDQIKCDIQRMEIYMKAKFLFSKNDLYNFKSSERDFKNLANKQNLYDKNGLVNDIKESNNYKLIPKEIKKKIHSKLTGDFYLDKNKKIYYKVDAFKKNPLSQIENYALTYSVVEKSNIQQIKKYDMIILEPYNVDKQNILDIESSDTKTYGYQTIFEVDESKLKEDDFDLKKEAYLYLNGEKIKSPYYGHYYGDIRSQSFQDYLFQSIEKNIIKKGFSGVFFDTLDNLETSLPLIKAMEKMDGQVKEELISSYIYFVRELNFKYPELSIILNRSFNIYNSGLGEYVDGIMYEGFNYKDFENPETSTFYEEELISPLVETAKKTEGVILALSYDHPEINYKMARKFNFLYFYYDFEDNKNLKKEETIKNVLIKEKK